MDLRFIAIGLKGTPFIIIFLSSMFIHFMRNGKNDTTKSLDLKLLTIKYTYVPQKDKKTQR